MRIAFCLFKYFPYGGLQRDFLRILNLCLHKGYKVTVYTMCWEGEQPANPNFKLKLIAQKVRSNHNRVFYFNQLLQQEFSSNNYDLTIGFNKLSGLDIYYCADSCYVAKNNEQKSKLINIIYKLTSRYKKYKYLESEVFNYSKTKILFLSDNEKKNYQKYYNLKEDNCYLLPPNIDKHRFDLTLLNKKQELKAELLSSLSFSNKPNNTKILLAVGSGFRTKGLDRNIKLLQHLNNTVNIDSILLVIGQDKPSSFLKLARKLGVDKKIFFLGGRSDIAKFMVISDLLLHPAYRENTGTVILESIIMGLPVVASGICGYSKYIKQSNCGRVIDEPFSQGYFNVTVKQLLLDNSSLDELSRHGLAFRETANIYNADQKILEIVHE